MPADKNTDIKVNDVRLTKSVALLRLSTIAKNSLQKANIISIGELIQLSEEYLLRTLKFKWIVVSEIKKQLSKMGLTLGTTVSSFNTNGCQKALNQEQVTNFVNLSQESLQTDDLLKTAVVLSADDVRLLKHIDDLGLSVRSHNCLMDNEIHYVGELVQKTEDYMFKIPNMGRKSVNELKLKLENLGLTFGTKVLFPDEFSNFIEIKNFLDKQSQIHPDDPRLLKNVNELELSIRSINCLKNDKIEYIGDLVQKTEADMLKTPNFGRTSLEEIRKQLSVLGLSFGMEVPGWPPENLNELLQQHKENYSVSFEQCLKEIEDYIQTKCTDIEKSVFNQRIKQVHGATLQALAEDINVTRERIRQIETKITNKILHIFSKNISFLNDIIAKFGSIIDYSVDNNDDIILIRQNSELLYNLFKNSSNYSIDLKKQWLSITADLPSFSINDSNLYSMDELVEHISSILSNILKNDTIEAKKNFNSILNKYIKQIIIDNFIFIDGRRTENTKSAVLQRFLSKYDLIPVNLKDLYISYNKFLIDNNLDNRKYSFKSEQTFSNTVIDRDDTLLSLGGNVRYYESKNYNITDLIERLNLDTYDLEYSCKKIFNSNTELMSEFNIQNEYELHNLLKKHYNKDGVDFLRMPIIRFGTTSREEQVINFAKSMSPISIYDLAAQYEDTFGVPQNTFMANYLQYLQSHTYMGTVSFDGEQTVSDIEKEQLLSKLTGDFYFIRDVEIIFKGIFGIKYREYLRQTILHDVGFYLTSQYILSHKYSTLKEYIHTKFDNMPILDLNLYKEYLELSSFSVWFYARRNEAKLIKIYNNKYISLQRLSEVGITSKILSDFTKQVLQFVGTKFFTVFSISNLVNQFDLFKFGFEDMFYEDVIKHYSDVSYVQINGTILFRKSLEKINRADFINNLMEHYKKINIYDLILQIKEEYGIIFQKSDITELTNNSDLYYNDITESLYINYDEFITSF